MITVDKVVRDLMDYFAAIGADAYRTFSIRDFNNHVMMNAYAPADRACLGLALESLARGGIVKPASATDYTLTPKGVTDVRAMRGRR